jgi:hypothetical protein
MWRKTAAVCLVLAPIALGVATGVDPAIGENDGTYGIYSAHPDALQWHSVLLHWAWVLFVPGLLGLLGGVRRRGAVLAAFAWVAVVVGLATFAALMAADLGLLAREQQGLTAVQLAAVDDRFGELGWATGGWQVPGLAGWALSLLLVPVVAARARVISWWVAGAALAGTALYLLFAVSPLPLNLSGPVVLVVAYPIAARQLIAGREKTGHAGREEIAEPDVFGAFRRQAGKICLVAAPVAVAVGMATVPPGEDVLAHPGLTQASGFFLHLAWVLFVPAVLTLAERGGRLTRVAGGVAVLGLLHFGALMVGDYVDLANRQALDPATADRVAERIGDYQVFQLGWVLPGIALTLLGLAAVPIAASVERRVRWWVPALVVAGLVAFLLLGTGPLRVVGPVLLIAGFGLAAVRQTPVVRLAPG